MMAEIKEDREGQHPSVTDLIGCLTKSYYDTDASNNLEPTDKVKLYFTIGLGLERNLLVSRKNKPIYGETDGIHWHVDSLDEGILELKSTRMSPKNHLEGYDFSERWLRQMKSYLRANGLKEVDLAILYLIQPDFHVFRLSFSDFELDTHWEWMKMRRDVWNEAKLTKTPPKAFTWNEDWECKDCVYKLLCELNASIGK